jgi:hypothetical protein
VRDVFVDVLLEVPARELLMLDDPARVVWERMREAADVKCAAAGARLRTDRAPEVLVQEARHLLGGDVTLVASRWAAVAPEGLETA